MYKAPIIDMEREDLRPTAFDDDRVQTVGKSLAISKSTTVWAEKSLRIEGFHEARRIVFLM